MVYNHPIYHIIFFLLQICCCKFVVANLLLQICCSFYREEKFCVSILMAETRYNSEDCRIEKRLQQMTDPGRYVLNVPGNGPRPDYIEDPQIILQKWGANLYSNSIDLESELKNINRNINKDCLGKDEYQRFRVNAAPLSYPSSQTMFTEQSRAIMPPWTVFDKQQVHFAYLPLNPQENVCFSFQNNLSTRILEKDYYQEKVDCQFYDISGQQAGAKVRETNFL